MGTRVRVTLTCLGGNLEPAERVLDLDVDQPTIQIGRASKTPSKNLQAGRENAWFDSPVMSRDHAEFSYDPKDSKLILTDIGSMHGTIVNSRMMEQHVATKLDNGDRIVFGAEVRRGSETFPACRFRVTYEISKYRPRNSYGFPEEDISDVEDEMTYEISDDESADEDSSDDGLSPASHQSKPHQPQTTIDLTNDHAFVYSSHPTTATDEKSGFQNNHVQDTRNSGLNDSSQYEVTSSTQEDCGPNTVYPDLECVSPDDETDSIRDDSSHYGSDASDDLIDVEEALAAAHPICSPEDSAFGFAATLAPAPPSKHSEHVPATQNSPANGQDASLGELLAGTRDFDTPDAALPIASMHSQSPIFHEEHHVSLPSTIPDSYLSNEKPHRVASPSDAALAKSYPRQADEQSISMLLGSTTNSLGNGSGKEEYFKAREANRAALRMVEISEEVSVSDLNDSHQAKDEEPRRILKLRLKGPSFVLNQHNKHLVTESTRNSKNEAELTKASEPSKLQPPLPPRAALRIDDIIDRNSPDLVSPVRKRKMDKISTVMQEEVKTWASVPAKSDAGCAVKQDNCCALSGNIDAATRSNKRLKRVLERIGYAALGGITVGAAVFGSLVATAPDFA